jgi:Mg-chelatase subunit ChlD
MKRSRREITIFSMSFLDVLCSGLGAVITLFLLSYQMTAGAEDLEGQIAAGQMKLDAQAEDRKRLDRELENLLDDIRKAKERAGASSLAVRTLEARRDALLRTVDFMGVQTNKRRILVVVDLSASMGSHSSVLMEATKKIVDLFRHQADGTSTFHFNLLTFQGTDESPTFTLWKEDADLHEATESNKTSAKEFIDGFGKRLGGYTPTLKAFEKAFEQFKDKRLEAVVLVTDGAPNGTEPNEPVTLEIVRQKIHALKPKDVEIKVIGVGALLYKFPSLVNFLIDLCDPKSEPPDAPRGKGSFIGL